MANGACTLFWAIWGSGVNLVQTLGGDEKKSCRPAKFRNWGDGEKLAVFGTKRLNIE